MSLINQALVDLEKRRDGGIESEELKPIYAAPSHEDARQVSYRWLKGLSTITFIVLVFAAGMIFSTEYRSTELDAKSPKIVATDTVVEGPETDEEIDTFVTETEPDILVRPTTILNNEHEKTLASVEFKFSESEQLSRDLTKFIALTRQAIADNRLSLPSEANALYYANKALEIDPGKEEALSLLGDIRSSYVKQLSEAIDTGDLERSRFLLSRAKYFELSDTEKSSYESRIAKSAARNAQPKIIGGDSPTQQSGYGSREKKIDRLKDVGESWVSESGKSKDQNAVAWAKMEIEEGNANIAVQYLREFLQDNPTADKSRVFLFDYFLKKNRVDDASFLTSGLEPDHMAYPYFSARLAVLAGNIGRAIDLLRERVPNEAIALQHNGLLAALFQQEKKHVDAQKLYKKLLTDSPQNVSFLLGYAISSDATGNTNDAIAAYQGVLKYGHKNQKVIDFVSSRLSSLRPDQRMEASGW